jgi:tRNA U55 pseudouridine synthase TruB
VRNGEDFEMKIRNTTIFEIEVLEFSYPQVTIRAKVAAPGYAQDAKHCLESVE